MVHLAIFPIVAAAESRTGQRGASADRRLYVGVDTNSSPGSRGKLGEWAKAASLSFVREGYSSRGINPQCLSADRYREWRWADFDRNLDSYSHARLKIIVIALQYNAPDCARGTGSPTGGLYRDPELYADYVEGLYRHIADRHPNVLAIELGNEPDVEHFWPGANGKWKWISGNPDAYLEFLRHALGRLKPSGHKGAHGDGRPYILAGSYGESSEEWWRRFTRGLRTLKGIDGLSVHAYPFQSQPPSTWDVRREVHRMRAIADGNGVALPFWITEYGIQTDPSCPLAVSESEQALKFDRLISYVEENSRLNVVALSWFSIQDDDRLERPKYKERDVRNCFKSFGMGLYDKHGRARPIVSLLAKRNSEKRR